LTPDEIYDAIEQLENDQDEIDSDIFPYLLKWNRQGVATQYSCTGHYVDSVYKPEQYCDTAYLILLFDDVQDSKQLGELLDLFYYEQFMYMSIWFINYPYVRLQFIWHPLETWEILEHFDEKIDEYTIS